MNTDRTLVERCLRNESKAQQIIYRKYSGRMHALCRRFAQDPMDAEDYLQEAFIRVFRNLWQYRFECPLECWIARTVINTALNCRRKIPRDILLTTLEEGMAFAGSPDHYPGPCNFRELKVLVACLPPRCRKVFEMRVIEGYSHKEIGAMLGMSENTSKSQFFRARLLLRRLVTSAG